VVRSETEDLNRLAAREIFQAIAAGRFEPGTILPNEFELAAGLGVSRTSLREAIKGLVAKGIVETRRKRGTQVLDRSHWNMLDPELMAWSRRDGSRRVSVELWTALIETQAVLAAEAASKGHAAGIVEAQLKVARATGPGPRRHAVCELLVEIAAAADNRFLRSLTLACVRNLLRDDPAFLDRQIDRLPAGGLADLVAAIAARRAHVARDIAGRTFAVGETVEA
jgi:DNA-binding FadR family transcriptional regulator